LKDLESLFRRISRRHPADAEYAKQAAGRCKWAADNVRRTGTTDCLENGKLTRIIDDLGWAARKGYLP
jgi:hypothetical protein